MARAYVAGFGGVIASEEPLASYIGAKVLGVGGNAVDAAVAVSLSLSTIIPHLGGFGGDFFALIVTPDGRVRVLNGSGASPRGLSMDVLYGRGLDSVPERGPLSIVVPGMVGALYEMWRRYGVLEWSKVLGESIRLAWEGFPAPPSLVNAVNLYSKLLEGDEGSKATYLNPPPELWRPYRFSGLAKLMEVLALDPRVFYEGEVAEAIVDYVKSKGGLLEVEDMKSYQPQWFEPLKTTYRDWILYEIPPNSQGVTTLHILKLLEDIEKPANPLSMDRFKMIVDAAIPSYRWRDLNLGDPRYMKIGFEELLSENVLKEIRGIKSSGEGGGLNYGDTTFYAIADRDGMIVAGIQSLFHPFGSGITEQRFQITLNNRALGFTTKRGLPNSLAPSKKPLHTLSALIMVDEKNERTIALGASGGHYRPQIHAILATNIADYNMNIEEAINSPRVAWDWNTNTIALEKEVKGITKEHKVVERIGVANAIEIIGKIRGGATDLRGDGIPIALT